ncbi:MAG: hypothetical protein WCK53_14535 [Methanomicrobiales archaeon]
MDSSISGRNIEEMLTAIITRLDRIEEKIDENSYPPEDLIKPDFITEIKSVKKEIEENKCRDYEDVDTFLKAIEG